MKKGISYEKGDILHCRGVYLKHVSGISYTQRGYVTHLRGYLTNQKGISYTPEGICYTPEGISFTPEGISCTSKRYILHTRQDI
jgi:hypothetical protein